MIALIGSIFLKDKGVEGPCNKCHKKRYTFSPDVEIMDGGTMDPDLLLIIEVKR